MQFLKNKHIHYEFQNTYSPYIPPYRPLSLSSLIHFFFTFLPPFPSSLHLFFLPSLSFPSLPPLSFFPLFFSCSTFCDEDIIFFFFLLISNILTPICFLSLVSLRYNSSSMRILCIQE